jgi:hypothetical protein
MKSIARLLITLVALLAAGCGALRSPGGEPWVKSENLQPVGEVESLLRHFEYVRKLAPADLAKEHETARQLFARSHTDFHRVRYAVVLSVAGTGFSDDARALELLDPLLKNSGAPLHNLAFVVAAQIQEQRRAQGLQQKLEALKSLEKKMLERGR